MSEPIKNTSELIDTYAGILNDIVREGTQGSYTYHGVLGCFLNEWIELAQPEKDWDTQEEIYEALTEGLKDKPLSGERGECPCGCGEPRNKPRESQRSD